MKKYSEETDHQLWGFGQNHDNVDVIMFNLPFSSYTTKSSMPAKQSRMCCIFSLIFYD